MPRRSNPDYTVDADRGRGTLAAKAAQVVPAWDADNRQQARIGLVELDAMTESMPGLSRQQRDRARITPRTATAELGHPRMQRTLPGPEEPRRPFSSRQKKARSKTRIATQGRLPDAQYEAQRRLMTDPGRWASINDALSRQVGDIQELPASDQEQVRRIDRSIQAYEQDNDRGHVLYANVAMPQQINHSNLRQFVARNFQAGDLVEFDRYTFATHQLHETSRDAGEDRAGRIAVLEIQTRRGAYLGHSDSQDDTAHLLPRAMRLRVVDTHDAHYTGPDGREGVRTVIQLEDVTPEPALKEGAR